MKRLWEILNLPRSLPILLLFHILPCKDVVREDLQIRKLKGSWWDLHLKILEDPLFRKVFFYRSNQCRPVLTKICKLFYRPFGTMELDAETIGAGIMIYHGYSTIVYAKEIGRNFTVYQQVTIGRGRNINGNDCPVIGDNVTVYAGAIIVGGVTIGNNAVIGAGAVVTKDVPDNATIIGAPMRILTRQG